jgi:hypothetical protein
MKRKKAASPNADLHKSMHGGVASADKKTPLCQGLARAPFCLQKVSLLTHPAPRVHFIFCRVYAPSIRSKSGNLKSRDDGVASFVNFKRFVSTWVIL